LRHRKHKVWYILNVRILRYSRSICLFSFTAFSFRAEDKITRAFLTLIGLKVVKIWRWAFNTLFPIWKWSFRRTGTNDLIRSISKDGRISNVIRYSIQAITIVYFGEVHYAAFSIWIKHLARIASWTNLRWEVKEERKCATNAVHPIEEWLGIGAAVSTLDIIRGRTYEVNHIGCQIRVELWNLWINWVDERLANFQICIELEPISTRKTYRIRVVIIIGKCATDTLISVKIRRRWRAAGEVRNGVRDLSNEVICTWIWILDDGFSTAGITLMNLLIQTTAWRAGGTFLGCHVV
jgi:hypothetical protein